MRDKARFVATVPAAPLRDYKAVALPMFTGDVAALHLVECSNSASQTRLALGGAGDEAAEMAAGILCSDAMFEID
jgi:hypothetical protein